MQSRGELSWARWIGNTAVILIVLIWLFPVYWIVATSLKKPGDIVNPIPSFLFFDHTLDNYRTIFGPTYTFADIVLNSFIIASCVTAVVILLAIPAAYSLARWDTKGSERIAMWILSLRMLPPVAVVIPYYVLATRFELIDNYAVLIIVYLAFRQNIAAYPSGGGSYSVSADNLGSRRSCGDGPT
jgi:ABC-type glycerol-3-phosphate transport system permease component